MDTKCNCETNKKKCITDLVIARPKKTLTTQEKNSAQAKYACKTIMYCRNNKDTKKQSICTCNGQSNLANGPNNEKNKTEQKFFK